ncbi:hypothetical protein DFH06DRAFT_1480277 [Mycena polygramma]|nr:hypothetical protein DFH06DRAFT_1480277 [Mycena polygramma]
MSLEKRLDGLSMTESKTERRIHFAVIGAGVAGLSCAIALRRIGHKVTLIEQKDDVNDPEDERGVRMPPNLTKILILWGLKDRLDEISIKSEAIQILLGDTGELLGTQHWDEELLRETRGEYLFAHLSDLIRLLYNEAIERGVEFRLGTRAASIEAAQGLITTHAGDILQADVVVGADGIGGITRRTLQEEQEIASPVNRPSIAMIPTKAILDNPDADVRRIYEEPHNTLFCWLGHEHSTVGFPVGGTAEFALCAYGPDDGIKRNLDGSEPTLKKLFPLILPASLRGQPVIECESLEDWVSESGRLVLIGPAAHPIPPGSIQEKAMSVEDGAVLAKLFSHLGPDTQGEQINQFLWAFQDIRQPRCAAATESETHIMQYMCMPKGDEQEARDAGLRAKNAVGIQALQAGDDEEETQEWREVKEVFGYDAEDEADNWWVSWGSLKLKSTETGVIDLGAVQVEQTVTN